jgi:ribose 5-phosphate isomerase A
MGIEDQKRAAAAYAAGLVEDGMAVGLGSGTTAQLAVQALGQRLRQGLHFVGVPTSEETARLARSLGIPLVSLDERNRLDIAIDGADEVDPQLNMIKGHGGALLREKIVARAAARFVVIIDDSKRVLRLGQRAPVPIEVIPFGWTTTKLRLEWLNFSCELRGGETPFKTASNNFILDCHPTATFDLTSSLVADSIKIQTGVVEHGLFLNLATTVVVGKATGTVDVLQRPVAAPPAR